MSTHSPLQTREHWLFPLLLVSALLQSLTTVCALWLIGLFLVAGRSETLRELLALGAALATAMVKIGLSLFGF